MAITTASSLTPDPSTTLNNILQTIVAGLKLAGISNPQVDPNSDFYILAQALTNQLSIAFGNLNVLANATMADTATGDDLTRLAGIFGVVRKVASSSIGYVLATVSSNSFVNSGAQLTSSSGLVFQVVNAQTLVSGSSPNTNLIQIESVDTGASTNLPSSTTLISPPSNSVLTWTNTPAFSQSTAVVWIACEGGQDAENDSALRTRLLNTLQNPPLYGNWQQIAQTATNASPFIEHAFVYPAVNGPSTQGVAFTQAQTSFNIVQRGVDIRTLGWLDGYNAVLSQAPAYVQTIIPYALATNDGYNDGYHSIKNLPNDVSFALNIPFPVGSNNNGIGGGWVNYGSGTIGPFPNPIAASNDSNSVGIKAAVVSTATSSTQIQITAYAPGGLADPALINGVSQVSWVADYTLQGLGWQVQTAVVLTGSLLSATGNIGTYSLILQTPLVDGNGKGPQVGQYIFPAITNGQKYLNTVLSSYANVGPGQMNAITNIFPNSYRNPITSLQNTDLVDNRFNQSLVVNNNEIETSSFYYNFSEGAEPAIPSFIIPAAGAAPGIWVPRNIGFYAIGV